MTDIVPRLRVWLDEETISVIMNEAADTIDALRAENEKLRAALQRVDDDHGYGLPPDTRSMIRAALEEKR